MTSTRAWELVNDPEYCGNLKMGEFHELLLKAGYPPDVAQKSASQRGWDRINAGAVM